MNMNPDLDLLQAYPFEKLRSNLDLLAKYPATRGADKSRWALVAPLEECTEAAERITRFVQSL